ncbi:MAG TPA: hypothetical protein VK718_10505 [Ferruginibacter sp.]|jgi:hypothetical protein|nr:hypothetical protein [Ferruginibacter sp.]
MKKIILFAAIGLLFASCKKTSSGTITTTNTLTATAFGDNFNFNTDFYTESYLNNSTAPYDPSFYAYAYDSLGYYMEVEVYGYYTNNLATKLYGALSDSTTSTYGEFYNPSGNDYYYNTSTTNPFTVTLTSIGTSIQGTYKGTLFDGSGDSVVITNGKFNIIQ